MTAVLSAVIIGSLCFSVGEGLRLTPFPVSISSSSQDAGDDAGTIDEIVVARYGPLDVPAPAQKRTKRHFVNLVCDVATGMRPFVASIVKRFSDANELPDQFSFIAPHSGRAPPFQS